MHQNHEGGAALGIAANPADSALENQGAPWNNGIPPSAGNIIPALYYASYLMNQEETGKLDVEFLNLQIGFKISSYDYNLNIDDIIRYIVERHSALNTRSFKIDDLFYHTFLDAVDAPNFRYHCLLDVEHDANETAEALVREYAWAPFNLENEPPIRGIHVRLNGNEHIINLTVHHAVCDKTSRDILAGDIRDLLQSHLAGLSPSPRYPRRDLQDYISVILTNSDKPSNAKINEIWRDRLSKNQCSLSAIRKSDTELMIKHFKLKCELSTAIEKLSKSGTTPNMLFTAATAHSLHCMSGAERLFIESISSNRVTKEFEGLVGCIIESIPLIIDTGGELSHDDLLTKVQMSYIDCLSTMPASFSSVVTDIGLRNIDTPLINWLGNGCTPADRLITGDSESESISPYHTAFARKSNPGNTEAAFAIFAQLEDCGVISGMLMSRRIDIDTAESLLENIDSYLGVIADTYS